MHRTHISLDQYSDFSANTDISPNYHPDFLDYYFAQLGIRPHIIGCFDDAAGLVAAYPTVLHSVFPNPLHKRVLPSKMHRLGDIGQPEILFPIMWTREKVRLNSFAPTTSPLLEGIVRTVRTLCFRKIAIAGPLSPQRIAKTDKSMILEHGRVFFTDDMKADEFADIYIRLHCERWARPPEDFVYVRQQILTLHKHLLGAVLFFHNDPVAAILTFAVLGKNTLYVDFINSGVKIRKTSRASAGSIILLKCLSRAQQMADAYGKSLRFSLGYQYGDDSYKRLWGSSQNTLVAF